MKRERHRRVEGDQKSSRLNVGEARYGLSVNNDGFQKHGLWAHPQAVIAIESAIDDELFHRFGVSGYADHEILFAFVVAIAAWFRARWMDGYGR